VSVADLKLQPLAHPSRARTSTWTAAATTGHKEQIRWLVCEMVSGKCACHEVKKGGKGLVEKSGLPAASGEALIACGTSADDNAERSGESMGGGPMLQEQSRVMMLRNTRVRRRLLGSHLMKSA
jgi:hypothetical protein